MRGTVARWLARRIGVEKEGVFRPPTSDLGIRLQEPDGAEVVMLSHGDSFDLICGKGEYTVIHITPTTALKLAWFTWWRWWVRGTWFGWRLSAWQWCVEVHLETARGNRAKQPTTRR